MEHITKSGHTSSQKKSSTNTGTPNSNYRNYRRQNSNTTERDSTTEFSQQIPSASGVHTPKSINPYAYSQNTDNFARSDMSNMIATNFFESTPPQEPYQEHDNVSSNKLTAQQFQNYLSDFSPPHHSQNNAKFEFNHQNSSSNSHPHQAYSESNMNAMNINTDFTQRRYQDTQSEDFGRKRNKSLKHMRATTNSARPAMSEKQRQRSKAAQRRPVSLEFSRKPRKIQYRPYTLTYYQTLAPVNAGHNKLGPNMEDEELQIKAKNYYKVRNYADVVNMKNKQHRPRQRPVVNEPKSKMKVAKEYAHTVNRVNKQKLAVSTHHSFKMTGSAALSSSSSSNLEHNATNNHQRGHKRKGSQMEEKLKELQSLHMRNRAIAQHILNDTFN